MNIRVSKPRVALIAGPTASGKSALALRLAQRTGGVVVNADSAQVYRDLRVVTARPPADEEAQAEHRLFGYIDGSERCSAARWASDAKAAIDDPGDVRLRILVGGTGLYIRTLLDGIAPVPEIAPDVRADVRNLPVAAAHDALVREDPRAAARLAPADTTRVARALEVVRSTGRTLADWQRDRTGGIGERIALSPLIMLPDRETLFARCDARLAAMFDAGALDEVEALLARRDVPGDAPIRRAIGVPEIAAYLSGALTRDAALDAARLATRQYAKRQYTWFRNQPPPTWPRHATQYYDNKLIEDIFLFPG